jgi:hypothetical protein
VLTAVPLESLGLFEEFFPQACASALQSRSQRGETSLISGDCITRVSKVPIVVHTPEPTGAYVVSRAKDMNFGKGFPLIGANFCCAVVRDK